MKILILGGAGMLGHKMVQRLVPESPEVWWTVRGAREALPLAELRSERCIDRIDLGDWTAVAGLLGRLRPDVVVNCAGVIKQRAAAQSPIPSITINSLLPHRLAEAQAAWGGRLIHFSTDCVFSGHRGHYTESDQSDAEDLYGRSKFLGEAQGPNALTLRTSIIGRELDHHQSLLDWFLLGDHASVRGFTRVWWSGVTTNHLAEVVAQALRRDPPLSGLFQVSSGRISKYDLLRSIGAGYGLDVEVVPDEGPVNDRSLDGGRFAAEFGYRCPPWEQLIAELVNDPTPYAHVARRRDA